MTFNPSLKNALLFFGIGLLLGLFLSFLWGQMLIPEYMPATQIESPKELVKQVSATEKVYTHKADSINVESQKLKIELNHTKAALTKAKEKTAGLQKQVFTLLDERFLMQQQEQGGAVCDSLATAVPILIAASEEKDSLYNSALTNLEDLVQNKDSLLVLQNEQYAALKTAFTKSIDAQTILAKDNLSLTKTVKRQKVKSKILSAALFIFSGAAATYLLRH